MLDRKHFFNTLRPLFKGLNQSQVDGCNAILDAWEHSGLKDLRWLAYMLATTFLETAKTMQPINEYGGNAYFHRMYDINGDRPHVARALGNTIPGDGVKFHGRGYVQLTGRANYKRASDVLGYDLVANPDLALKPNFSAQIMFSGMVEGWFTGKKLADYISGSRCDYVNARRIINGVDKAKTIAGYARTFETALRIDRTAETGAGAIVTGAGTVAVERAASGDPHTAVIVIGLGLAIAIATFILIKRRKDRENDKQRTVT